MTRRSTGAVKRAASDSRTPLATTQAALAGSEERGVTTHLAHAPVHSSRSIAVLPRSSSRLRRLQRIERNIRLFQPHEALVQVDPAARAMERLERGKTVASRRTEPCVDAGAAIRSPSSFGKARACRKTREREAAGNDSP